MGEIDWKLVWEMAGLGATLGCVAGWTIGMKVVPSLLRRENERLRREKQELEERFMNSLRSNASMRSLAELEIEQQGKRIKALESAAARVFVECIVKQKREESEDE